MRNRIWTLLLAFVLVLGSTLLSGCAPQQTNNQNPPDSPQVSQITAQVEPQPSPGPENATPVTVEFWHVHSETFGGPAIRQIVENFNIENPDIKVIPRFHPGMYLGLTQSLHAALAANAPPELTQLGNNWVEYGAANFPHITIEDILDNEGRELLNSLPEPIIALGQRNGIQVAMPWSLSNPVVFYNADMFAQAGLDPANPPQTWTQIREASIAIKEKTGNYGLYIQEPGDFWAQQALIESNGAQLLMKTGNDWITGIDSVESIEAFQLYADMVLTDQTAIHAPWEQGVNAFIGGKIGMVITTIARRNHIEGSANFNLAAAPFPSFDDKQTRLPAGGNVLMITANETDRQQAAWKFIKYLHEAEPTTLWIKGTGYVPLISDIAKDPNFLKPFMDENPIMSVAMDQVGNTVPWVNFPGANAMRIEQILIDTRAAILTGQKEVADALREAAQSINELLP